MMRIGQRFALDLNIDRMITKMMTTNIVVVVDRVVLSGLSHSPMRPSFVLRSPEFCSVCYPWAVAAVIKSLMRNLIQTVGVADQDMSPEDLSNQ
jgi:hypothetical protein